MPCCFSECWSSFRWGDIVLEMLLPLHGEISTEVLEQYSWHTRFTGEYHGCRNKNAWSAYGTTLNSDQSFAICANNVAQESFVFLQIILGNLLGTLSSVLEILFGGSCAFQIQHVHHQRIWLLELHWSLYFSPDCILRQSFCP